MGSYVLIIAIFSSAINIPPTMTLVTFGTRIACEKAGSAFAEKVRRDWTVVWSCSPVNQFSPNQ